MLYNTFIIRLESLAMSRPFRFSIALPANMRPLAPWRETLGRIEDSGVATIAVADHFTSGYSLEPMVALAAAAMCTTQLRLQTAVLGNDYRHPVLVHRSATLLDVLSQGRLELGLGAGWMLTDYQTAGIPYDSNGERIARWQEAIAIIKGLFGPEPFTFKGEHYCIDGLDGLPKPVQQPFPPLLLGGGGPRVLRIVGREADIAGINTNLGSGVQGTDNIYEFSTDAVAEKVGWVRQGAEAAGRRFEDIELSLAQWLLHVTPSRAEAEAVVDRMAQHTGCTPALLMDAPGVLVGSVVQCAEKLIALRERTGISYIQLEAGGRPRADIASVAPLVGRLAGN